MHKLSSQTIAEYLYHIRDFIKYLCSTRVMDNKLSSLFPVILGHKNSSLPSVYSTDEVRRLLDTDTDGQCQKRDRAMLLLASQLGVRTVDIRNLCFGDINWRLNCISFTQHKTKKPLTLPLPDECKFALVDYLKNERPESDSPRIFLKARAPFEPFDNKCPFYYVVDCRFSLAEINTTGKHHGMHSLRHSLAVNMLDGNTPYPVISGVLGHSNANTTRRYLRVDTEKLRGLSLELPNV
jgi:integrase